MALHLESTGSRLHDDFRTVGPAHHLGQAPIETITSP